MNAENHDNSKGIPSNGMPFFVPGTSLVFEELAEGLLALEIHRLALKRFPAHWAVLMVNPTKLARFLTTLHDLWIDGFNEPKDFS